MRAVVQRVNRSSVSVEGTVTGAIEGGLNVLLGVSAGDTSADADYLAEKIVNLRIFEDDDGKMNRSLADVGGSMLCISQFTLFGDCRKGRRPSFSSAAPPERAAELYEYFMEVVRSSGIEVASGVFRAHMKVWIENDGPVTLLLDSQKNFKRRNCMLIDRISVGAYAANCYILADEETLDAVVIDPGAESARILERIQNKKLNVSTIILTHGHGDHIGGVAALKEKTGAKVVIHHDDAEMLGDATQNLTAGMSGPRVTVEADKTIDERDEIVFGKHHIKILHTPGHTTGGICLYLPEEKVVFTGDTLFYGSVGRTDLGKGNHRQLIKSIIEKLMTLNDEVIVYPGHGASTSIGFERRKNPFIQG